MGSHTQGKGHGGASSIKKIFQWTLRESYPFPNQASVAFTCFTYTDYTCWLLKLPHSVFANGAGIHMCEIISLQWDKGHIKDINFIMPWESQVESKLILSWRLSKKNSLRRWYLRWPLNKVSRKKAIQSQREAESQKSTWSLWWPIKGLIFQMVCSH